jgi:XTP/dITP diphosphohydrolase
LTREFYLHSIIVNMELVFATHNRNKLLEIKSIVPSHFTVVSLADKNILEEIPEPFETIAENSFAKANYIFSKYNMNCFSEDTGLVVPALNGAPGVKSARYAGDNATTKENIDKLLAALSNCSDRRAYFQTIITLILDGTVKQFEGRCYGIIIAQPRGESGFGYDPVFMPLNAKKVFSEMSLEEKNMYSHRKKATAELLDFLAI